jgi:hypothetical protein
MSEIVVWGKALSIDAGKGCGVVTHFSSARPWQLHDGGVTQARMEVAEAREAAEAASTREAQAWREVATDTTALRQNGSALMSALRRVVGLTLSATASIRQAAATLAGGAADIDGRLRYFPDPLLALCQYSFREKSM